MAEQSKTDAEGPASDAPAKEGEMAEFEIELNEAWIAVLDLVAENKGVSREELVVQVLEEHLREIGAP